VHSNKGEEPAEGKKKSRKQASKIDLGIFFLENAYRILKENGRMEL
jgi:type I restriction enzyme M protein